MVVLAPNLLSALTATMLRMTLPMVLDGAYIAHHAEVPAAVFAERGKEYAEGGAGAEVDEHDQESAYRRLIAENFLDSFTFSPP